MLRLLMIPALTVLACVLAALYGALHNQISYSVGPDYFHAFKFVQFNIGAAIPDRLGGAWVGVQASWWMGVVIGLPLAIVCAFAPDLRSMVALFLRIAVIVIAITLSLGLASLLLPADRLVHGLIRFPPGVTDPAGFAQAALMHDVSYLAGALSLVIGLALAGVRIWRMRR